MKMRLDYGLFTVSCLKALLMVMFTCFKTFLYTFPPVLSTSLHPQQYEALSYHSVEALFLLHQTQISSDGSQEASEGLWSPGRLNALSTPKLVRLPAGRRKRAADDSVWMRGSTRLYSNQENGLQGSENKRHAEK